MKKSSSSRLLPVLPRDWRFRLTVFGRVGILGCMGDNPANPGVSSTDPAAASPVTNEIPNVNPAMPNAMGVGTPVQPTTTNAGIGQDPNVAPNPFASPTPNSGQPIGTASVMPPTPPGVAPAPANPEVVTSGGGHGNRTPWMILGAIAVIAALGALGAFVYFSVVAVQPEQALVPTPMPVTEASASASPRAMTIEERISAEEAGLSQFQSSMTAVDTALNDKQGDLSE